MDYPVLLVPCVDDEWHPVGLGREAAGYGSAARSDDQRRHPRACRLTPDAG